MNFLLVDDEPGALEVLVQAAREAAPKAGLFAFDRPSAALECAGRQHIDVAFLDIDMGGQSGLELAQRLKALDDDINIVFVTVHSNFAVDAFALHASGYLLKPASGADIKQALENLRRPPRPVAGARLCVRTFGNFEVLLGGKPLHFPRSKAKELLAYLVHKRGTGCGAKEIASVLYEDQAYTLSVQRQVQTVIHTLVKTLKDAGCGDVLLRSYNNLAVDTEKIDCDYYRLLDGEAGAARRYTGEYLANYSWAEFTSGYLAGKSET